MQDGDHGHARRRVRFTEISIAIEPHYIRAIPMQSLDDFSADDVLLHAPHGRNPFLS
jgi:hypothetical protein